MLPILSAPNPVLSQKAAPIKKVSKEIRHLIEEMKETLVNTTDPEGVGLAAPQIGKSLQLFIVKETPDAPFYTFINPQITVLTPLNVKKKPTKKKKTDRDGVKLEGCLSLPHIWGTVERAPKVKVSYLDEDGNQYKNKVYGGFFATILQHEYDHLQGILFPKLVVEQNGNLYRSKKDDKSEDVFEPIELP